MCKLMEDLINDVVKDRDIDTAKEYIALGKLSLSKTFPKLPSCPYQLSRNWQLQ